MVTLKSDVSKKLNHNRIGHININEEINNVLDADPYTIINHSRFDIMAKYIYGKFYENKWNSNWGTRLYDDHIWTFNRYDEDDGSGKKGIKSFVKNFNSTLDSIKKHGFDDNVSLIPISNNGVPLDGAHRLTAALLYKKKVKVIKMKDSNICYNYEFFNKRGLLSKWSDAIAYEYCKLKHDIFIVILFPEAFSKKEKAKDILKEFGSIYYEKEIKLIKNGPKNLLNYLFKQDKWFSKLTTVEKDVSAVKSFFNDQSTINVIVFEPKDLKSNLIQVKKELENLYGYSKHSFYINSNHSETIRLSQMMFNENSIHFLNNAEFNKDFFIFEKIKNTYSYFIKHRNIDPERICLVSDAVLAAYGIRDCENLGFIYYGYTDLEKEFTVYEGLVNNNNLHFRKPIDDIIFNPENHFYYDGIKFTTLKIMKKSSKEILSKKDIRMIKEYTGNWTNNANKELLIYYIIKKLKILKFKIINIKLKFKKIYEQNIL
ncbi:hypothetical protein [Bacillus sp. NEB1478]|uniref:hypothetical protein n=1 Tax=Bacillus sp. NEB1478 TaxID=3073816 RepID=UPI002873C983|nr:hypothetical protein [Bacillus sp. NEB1478]WNB92464.1 hypothetical protein RGB74_02015 [Bacillus sp. NEB1478]